MKNWGTKWEAREGSVLRNDNELNFTSAWSAPWPVIEALSKKFPSVRFDHEWASEDMGYCVGRCTFLAGDVINAYFPEEGSKEATDMANKIWEYDTDTVFFRVNIPLDQQISAAENSRDEQGASSDRGKVSTQDREEVR